MDCQAVISAEESLGVGFGYCVIYAALRIRLSANQIFDTAPNSNRRRVTCWSAVDVIGLDISLIALPTELEIVLVAEYGDRVICQQFTKGILFAVMQLVQK